jgi:hypothetical protein
MALGKPAWDAAMVDIGTRLRALEAVNSELNDALAAAEAVGQLTIANAVEPLIVAVQAEIDAIQAALALAEDQLQALQTGGVLAVNVPIEEVAGLVADNTQEAFEALVARAAAADAAINAAGALIAAIKVVGSTLVTASATLVAGRSYRLTATTGAIVLTLPASPASGDTIRIVDGGSIGNGPTYSLARNGQTIMSLAEDMAIDTRGIAFEIWFNGTTWRLV